MSPLYRYDNLPYGFSFEELAMATTARLEARISVELHAALKRAAELKGRTMTDFVVSAVQEAAQRAFERRRRLLGAQ